MKKIQFILIIIIAGLLSANAQEKRIKFKKGTLKICSSKKFQIEGYNGSEVIIKNLSDRKDENATYLVTGYASNGTKLSKNSSNNNLAKLGKANTITSSTNGKIVFFNNNSNRKKGLKKLGTKSNNADLGIYFTIEQKGDELIFRDQNRAALLLSPGEKYLVKIPNSIKLNWKTQRCGSGDVSVKNQTKSEFRPIYYNSNASSLKNFSGEVEIASTLSNIKLVDVNGPTVINTIGGNVTIEFDKTYPKALYSIYTNNGFIDIQIPKKSSLLMNVIAKSVYSDVNFKVLEEEVIDDIWQTTNKMKLKYGSGKVKMKLNGGFGEVYLRKK